MIKSDIGAAELSRVPSQSQRQIDSEIPLGLAPVTEHMNYKGLLAPRSVFSDRRQRVLIVDDVPEILSLLGKLVARMGYQVETAETASDAVQILRRKRIDLVITDWAMPDMNGGQLITLVRRDRRLRDTPCVVLTCHDTESGRRDAELAGCDRFLLKPVKREELQRTIENLLEPDRHTAATPVAFSLPA